MIVAYYPSKRTLRYGDETKVMADVQAGPQMGSPGHYFACRECGACGPIHAGEGSRLRAVINAHTHVHTEDS